MKRFFLFLIITITTITFNSCNSIDDGVNFKFTTLKTISAEFPEVFEINKTYTIKVTYLRPDTCTFFEGFNFVREEQTIRNIAAIGYVLTEEQDCKEIAEQIVTSFEFSVLYTGTYTFKFWIGENENGEAQYLEIDVPVIEQQ